MVSNALFTYFACAGFAFYGGGLAEAIRAQRLWLAVVQLVVRVGPAHQAESSRGWAASTQLLSTVFATYCAKNVFQTHCHASTRQTPEPSSDRNSGQPNAASKLSYKRNVCHRRS